MRRDLEMEKGEGVSKAWGGGCTFRWSPAHGGNGHYRPKTRVCQKGTAYCYRPPPPGWPSGCAIKMSLKKFESRFVRKSAPRRFASREPIMDLLLRGAYSFFAASAGASAFTMVVDLRLLSRRG